jgi:hypothetical protein
MLSAIRLKSFLYQLIVADPDNYMFHVELVIELSVSSNAVFVSANIHYLRSAH